jgi:NADH-quinone oxidoreductase subunit A
MTPGSYVPAGYLPIVFMMIAAFLFAVGILISGGFLRPKRSYSESMIPYESGNDPVGETGERFSVKFYVIAMLFVVFDVEIAFLYPWAINFDNISSVAMISVLIFIAILIAGYIYDWKKGAFDMYHRRKRR